MTLVAVKRQEKLSKPNWFESPLIHEGFKPFFLITSKENKK